MTWLRELCSPARPEISTIHAPLMSHTRARLRRCGIISRVACVLLCTLLRASPSTCGIFTRGCQLGLSGGSQNVREWLQSWGEAAGGRGPTRKCIRRGGRNVQGGKQQQQAAAAAAVASLRLRRVPPRCATRSPRAHRLRYGDDPEERPVGAELHVQRVACRGEEETDLLSGITVAGTK